jgi:hypothetical protein
MSAISAVLPLKAYGRRYIDDPGRCHILLTSLATFAPDDMFEDIFVVVPARERAHAEALRRDWQSLPLVVIDEEEILPTFRDHPLTLNAGWYRQQLVKLCAANLSKTEFFITFDSDVILTKPICEADILRDGKALLEPGDRAIHSRWWTGSGDILGVPVDLSAPGMAVTPAILSRTICRRLFQHLEDRSQQAWADLLLRRSLDNLLLKRARDNWSEYSLYYLLAEHDKVLFDYHFPPPSEDAARLHCQSSVWTKAQFAGWDPKYCFDRDTAGLFLIVQSSSTISLELICRRLNPHLPITRPVTASLTHRLRSLWEDIRTVDGLFSWCDRSMGARASRKLARARGRRRLWRHNLPPRARSVDGFKRTPPTVALAEGLLIGQC